MSEQTILTPQDEALFQQWVQANHITDVDDPRSRYDYRGFWKQTHGAPHPPGSEQHFPDTFKQHGHPTFSVESQYSAGPFDGGRWRDDRFVPPGADMQVTSRGGGRLDTEALMQALSILARTMKQ